MPPCLSAIAILATALALCLGVVGAIGGALTIAAMDDAHAHRAGIAVSAGGLALFVASANILAQLVLA